MSSLSPTASPTPSLSPLRWVITAVFFAFASGFGFWAGSIPTLLRQTGATAAQLGWSLALHSAAYIVAMSLGGQLAHRIAPRHLLLGTLPLHAAGFWVLFGAHTPVTLTLGLLCVGLSGGLIDLAMNAEGAAVERALGRPVLSRMHAAASGAFALGALGGSLLATGLGPPACALAVALIIAPVLVALARVKSPLPAASSATASPATAGTTAVTPGIPSASAEPNQRLSSERRTVWLFGILLGTFIGAEMCAQMWSATLIEELSTQLAAYAGAGAAFFAGCQSVVRWWGDALRRRLGDETLITRSLMLSILGFALVAGSPWFALSLAGFALIGLGTGCLVPCCFAIVTQRNPARAAANLGAAAFVAGVIRLPTPLALGAVAAALSDAMAFALVAVALVLSLGLMRSALKR